MGGVLMASAKRRVAVIGTGKISEEHLGFLSGRNDLELVGVCDLSPVLARFSAERFGAARAYTDHEEMLEEARPDVVHVLTPPATHEAIASSALRAGAHVVLEKPAAPTLEGLERLLSVAEESGRLLVEDHNYRFNRPVLALDRAVRAGRLGRVREVEVRMDLGIRAGGRYADTNLRHASHDLPAGVLHEFITHLSYLLLRFLPGVDDVSAVWANRGGDDLFRFDDLDARVAGGDAVGRLRFSCCTWPDTMTVTVRGEEATARADLFHPYFELEAPRGVGAQLTPIANRLTDGVSRALHGVAELFDKVRRVTPYEGLHEFLARFYAALESGSEPPVTPADMRAVGALVDRLVEEAPR